MEIRFAGRKPGTRRRRETARQCRLIVLKGKSQFPDKKIVGSKRLADYFYLTCKNQTQSAFRNP
jgi:hypothetical protein